jgi:phosphatidate cytidylyltransferase
MDKNESPSRKDTFSLKARWISGICGGVAVSWMFLNINTFIALATLSTALASYEYIRLILVKKGNIIERYLLTVLLPFLTFISGVLLVYSGENNQYRVFAIYGLAVPLVTVFEFLFYRDFVILKERISDTVFGIFYIAFQHFIGIFIYWKFGWPYAVLGVTSTWIFDSFAFFTGIRYGKHPLMPSISPKKTIEGTIGGFIGGFFGLWIFIRILDLFWGKPLFSFWQIGVVSLALLFSATFGDLFESILKRTFSLKDIGRILPGHGGWLDRIDSMLFFMPMLMLLLLLFS